MQRKQTGNRASTRASTRATAEDTLSRYGYTARLLATSEDYRTLPGDHELGYLEHCLHRLIAATYAIRVINVTSAPSDSVVAEVQEIQKEVWGLARKLQAQTRNQQGTQIIETVSLTLCTTAAGGGLPVDIPIEAAEHMLQWYGDRLWPCVNIATFLSVLHAIGGGVLWALNYKMIALAWADEDAAFDNENSIQDILEDISFVLSGECAGYVFNILPRRDPLLASR